MKLIQVGTLGVVIQGVFLIAFIMVARMSISVIGKPVIIGIATAGMAVLIWYGIRSTKTRTALCLLPVALAFGYTIAYHMVGLLGFRGLLRDFELSLDYFLSSLRVTAMMFVLYSIGTAVLYVVGRTIGGRVSRWTGPGF